LPLHLRILLASGGKSDAARKRSGRVENGFSRATRHRGTDDPYRFGLSPIGPDHVQKPTAIRTHLWRPRIFPAQTKRLRGRGTFTLLKNVECAVPIREEQNLLSILRPE